MSERVPWLQTTSEDMSTFGHAGLTISNGKQPGISYNTDSFSTADAVLSGFNSLGIIVSDQPLMGQPLATLPGFI